MPERPGVTANAGAGAITTPGPSTISARALPSAASRRALGFAGVRYLVGLPPGTRAAPSRTAIGDFRRAVVAAGVGAELFDQQVNWLGRLPALVDPQKDDFGIDATRFEAAVAQPTIIGLLQHGLRRVMLAVRSVAP